MGKDVKVVVKVLLNAPSEWTNKLKALNMLPELIRMACTANGVWASGKGPRLRRSMGKLHSSFYFLFSAASPSITFPDFVGAITGVSYSGIGIISEKVLTFVVLGPTSKPS